MTFGTVVQAIEDIRAGKLVIVADDEHRENEGDFVAAAERVTPALINFMTKHGRGLICLTLTPERCRALDLPQMVEQNTEGQHTAFTVSVDAAKRFGVTTGISAADRSTTIQVAIDPETVPSDLRRPGHVFPLQARPGGVLQRVGQTEASVDLARLAGLQPAGVICEVLNEDGTMARRPQLEEIAKTHGLTFITVAQIVAHRLKNERLVHRVAEARLPTPVGEWTIVGYRNDVDQAEHVALVHGEVVGFAIGRADDGNVWALFVEPAHEGRGIGGALRLRLAAGKRHAGHRGRGRRRGGVPRPGGPWHRTDKQAARLRAPGSGPRHGRGQRLARLRARAAQ